MKKAQIITISVCAVGAVALLAAGFVLYRGVARFGEARDALNTAKARLEGFYQEAVFPSATNVLREQSNTQQLDRWYRDLAAELRKGNVVSTERSPSAFKTVFLEKTLERLLREAQAAGTELPANFGFGFEQYAGTPILPRPDDVPRLMEQLVLVNRVCRILFENRVKAISSVGRAMFEEQMPTVSTASEPPPSPVAARRPVRRGAAAVEAPPPGVASQPGVVPAGALFGKYRFVFEFSSKESALVGVLNALAASPSFTVVKVVRLTKGVPVLIPVQVDTTASGGVPAPGLGAAPVATPALTAVRLGPNYPVSGLEMEIPMQVRIELDVFKFKGDSDESGD